MKILFYKNAVKTKKNIINFLLFVILFNTSNTFFSSHKNEDFKLKTSSKNPEKNLLRNRLMEHKKKIAVPIIMLLGLNRNKIAGLFGFGKTNSNNGLLYNSKRVSLVLY
jgi:hypothetical protein